MSSQPKRHQNRKSNSKICLVSFNLQYAFIVLHTQNASFFLSFLIRATINLIFESRSNENATNKKILWSFTSHQLPVVVYHRLRCRFFSLLYNFSLTISSICSFSTRTAITCHTWFLFSFHFACAARRPRSFIYEHDFIKQNNNNVCLNQTNKRALAHNQRIH